MDIQPIFRCSVGIDVHLALICVCIIVADPGMEPVMHLREFGGFKRGPPHRQPIQGPIPKLGQSSGDQEGHCCHRPSIA